MSANGGPPPEQVLLSDVAEKAQALAASVNAAADGGVPPAVLLPHLFIVFQEVGMIPEGFGLGDIMGGLQ